MNNFYSNLNVFDSVFKKPAMCGQTEAEQGAQDLEAIMAGKGGMMDKEEMMEALLNQGGASM